MVCFVCLFHLLFRHLARFVCPVYLLTSRGVVHRTSGLTSYETIPHVQLEISGDVLSTVVQRRDGPRRLREIDDDDEFQSARRPVTQTPAVPGLGRRVYKACVRWI